MLEEKVSILKASVWLPDNTISYDDISLSSGLKKDFIKKKLCIERIFKCDSNTDNTEMALNAASLILNKDDKESIDLILWTGSENKKYPMWLASTYLKNELDIKNASCIDISCQSSSDIAGLRIAKAMLDSDKNLRKILILGGHKINQYINYKDTNSSFLFSFSDGASSWLIGRGENNNIHKSAHIADGSFSLDVTISKNENHSDNNEFYCVKNIHSLRSRLTEYSLTNYTKVIKDVSKKSSYLNNNFHLAINHMNKKIITRVQALLKPIETILCPTLEKFGHIGSVDPLLSLCLAEKKQSICSGDYVCLASAGLGYSWDALSFRWSKEIVKCNIM